MHRVCYNGVFWGEHEAVMQACNKSYRYGDGFFETIKVRNGIIALAAYHANRIEASIALLGYTFPPGVTSDKIFAQILELCKINNCLNAARVRLSFSNGNGGIADNEQSFHYMIEAWPLDIAVEALNEVGLSVGFFPLMKKSVGVFAQLKSASALLFTQAAKFSKERNLDDCVVLNCQDNVCESSIANIFWIKENQIYTPALTEGCVAGVMRAYLIDALKSVVETTCSQNELLHADEVFFTNAIRGIRWVRKIEGSNYKNDITKSIFCNYIEPQLQ